MSDDTFLKRLLMVITTIVLLLSLWYLRSIWLLGFAAVVIAVGISIPVHWLQQRGLSRNPSLFLSLLVLGLVVIFLILWIVPTIISETGSALAELPRMWQEIGQRYETWRSGSDLLIRLLPPFSMLGLNQTGDAALSDALRRLFTTGFSFTPILEGMGAFASVLANVALVIFIAIFFLGDPLSYVQISLHLTPAAYHDRLLYILSELYRSLTQWIKTQFLSVSITVSLVWLVLGLLGVPYAPIIAVFAGVATFIPNLGAFLPLIPIFVFTMAEDPSLMLWAIPAYLAIQLLESNVITPTLIREELQLPSAGVLLFQLVGAALFGGLGLLLAVPLLLVLIVLVREIYSYDILGLRAENIEITVDAAGRMHLDPTSRGQETEPESPERAQLQPQPPEKSAQENAPLSGSPQGMSTD
ncbi:MAG: AI-2E family transporter [Anaerolineae bacterium]|nr:AI-2E family transporter [Anaerolineae bacterium]